MNEELDLPIVKTDLYTAEEELLKMSTEFFKTNDGDKLEVSKSKNSIFGYFTQAASYILKSSALHKNLLLDEFFLNTASIDSSIYNFAKLYNYNIEHANPSRVNVNLAISCNDLMKSLGVNLPLNSSVTRKFRIQKETKFNFGSFMFMLPSAINLTINYKKDGSGKEIFSGNAVYTAETDGLYNLKDKIPENLYIKAITKTISIGSGEYNTFLILDLAIYQVTLNRFITTSTAIDLNETLEYEYDFNEQLADFTVEVKEPLEGNFKMLKPEFNNLSASTEEEKVIHYNFPSENRIRLYFGNNPEYRPPFNSELRFSIYTTRGENSNFTYDYTLGDQIVVNLDIIPNDEEYTDLESTYLIDLSGTKTFCANTTSATGGRDKLTVEEIKKELIRKILTRENLITDIDLNYFFKDLALLAKINNGKIMFFKKRDDVIKRLFNAFVMLKDNEGNIIPTNTINLNLTFDDLYKSSFMLKAGTLIIYDKVNSVYKLMEENENVSDYINNDYFVYSLPFLTKVKVEGENSFPRNVFYKNSINDTYIFSFKNTPTTIGIEGTINNLNIVRNSIFDDTYTFLVNMYVSSQYENVGEDNLAVLLRFYTGKYENKNYVLNMICVKDKRAVNTWYCDIKTTDVIDNNENIIVQNIPEKKNLDGSSLRVVQGGCFINNNTSYIEKDEYLIPEKFGVEAIALFNIGGIITKDQKNPLTPYQIQDLYNKYDLNALKDILVGRADKKLIIDPDNFPNSKIYIPLNSFILADDQKISIFHSLSEIFNSDLVINNDGTFLIKELPVIGTQYFSNYTRSQNTLNLIDQYDSILNSQLDKLEMNTTINLKFFNTYGYSRYFSSNKTNLNIALRIKNDNITEEIDERIRKEIIKLVEDSNEKNYLSFSDISRKLLNEFTSIKYLDVVGINNVGTQVIEKIKETDPNNMTKEEVQDYIPEFLNINRKVENNSLTYCIDIEYI